MSSREQGRSRRGIVWKDVAWFTVGVAVIVIMAVTGKWDPLALLLCMALMGVPGARNVLNLRAPQSTDSSGSGSGSSPPSPSAQPASPELPPSSSS